jgi:hypothetical protein
MFKGKPKNYDVWNKGTIGLVKANAGTFQHGISVSPATQFKKGQFAGENHFNWHGGISEEGYPFNFNEELKELIRKRDGYKCRMCGCENEVPSVHHIDLQ